jgi:hypothetical protein
MSFRFPNSLAKFEFKNCDAIMKERERKEDEKEAAL